MKSTLLQARQDKSFKSTAYGVALTSVAATDVLTFTGGSVVGSVNVDLANSQGVRTGAAYTDLDFNNRRHLRRHAQLQYRRRTAVRHVPSS